MRIGLLGPLQVHDGVGRPVRVGGHRVRALLILLALDANQVVPAYSLIARLWGDERPADAMNALQSLVSRLRGALRQADLGDGVIESSPAGYRLAVRPEQVDAIAFEAAALTGGQALAAGDATLAARVLREALAAWRGPALADVADEEFAIAQAARLEELRAGATLDRIEADLLLGEGPGLVGELRAVTAADPLAERPRALLMRALSAAGRQADALAVYHEVRELLADRLGVDPSARLEQVYLQILRQEPGDSHPPERSVVPPQAAPRLSSGLTSFVGRDEDVSGVVKKLAEDRLVTLTGPGGVGKTRLAAEVLARLGNPACFAELAPVTQPAEVPYAVLDAMGIGERRIARKTAAAGPAAPLDRLRDTLSGRDMVVVLDNCEHVVDAAAGLAEYLLADCPRVRILATSREPLRIGGETLWVVSPLPVPPAPPTATALPAPSAPSARTDISEISRYPAIQLLRDRAAAVLPGFELNEANAAAIADICRVLDGMPLAIELAAVWLRTLTPAQLAERLADRFALLTSGSRTALPRHQTLRAVVDWSWDLLSDPERVLARRLAIFPAGAALTAAEQICADDLLPRPAILPALSGLVSKSILTAAEEPGGSGPRYRMLETVRAYGLERLTEAGESDRFRNAMTGYYLDFAEAADPRLRTADQVRWFRQLSMEQDNLHASLRWSIARRDGQTALRMVRALGYYWVQRGGEGDALAREVLALGPPPVVTLRIAEARVICALLAAGWSWDVDSVRDQLNEAITCLGRWSDSYASFHPLAAMAEPMITMYDGEHERSLAHFEKYLVVDDPWLRAMALLYRASGSSTIGRLDATIEADCAAALAEFRKLGEKWGTAITLTQLAEFAELRADHAAAIAELAEAAALGSELGAWGDLSYIDGRLAIIRARAGDLAIARAEFDRAERAAAERGGHNDIDRWLAFMRAELAWREGDLRAAADCCTATLAAIADNTAAWWQSLRAQVKARLAMVTLAQGDTERSRELLTDAWRAAGGWVEHPPLAIVLDALAVYVLRRGQDGEGAREGAETAARLLGAAHGVRGAFDHSSLDAPAAQAAALAALGTEDFDAEYQRGRALGHAEALALAGEVLGVATPLTDRDRGSFAANRTRQTFPDSQAHPVA